MLLWVLTGVVDTSLDDIVHGEATGGGLSPQLAVDLLGQHLQQVGGSEGRSIHKIDFFARIVFF